MFWGDSAPGAYATQYGISYYNRGDPNNLYWETIVGFPSGTATSAADTLNLGSRTNPIDLVNMSYAVPANKGGTYRFYIQPAGYGPTIVSKDFDVHNAINNSRYASFTETFSSNVPADVWYGGGYGFYIPKNTQTLDVEISSAAGLTYTFQFFTGLPTQGMTWTRNVAITPGSNGATYGFNSIPINANERGTIGWVVTSGGASAYQKLPYLDSVPMRYAFNVQQLTVPRKVATTDGLTPL